MSQVRVVFLGTPEFAVSSLKVLLSDEHYNVVGVVTQPDRPAGRKLVLTPSPVKRLAMENDLPILTPESMSKSPEALEMVRSWGAEIAVVVAYGQILSDEFLKMFTFGAVNIHGSLLPRWRGAAPIQRAIEAGDSLTGVSLQKMAKKLDAGDVIGARTVPITSRTTATDLYAQLASLGADMLHVELMDYIRGNLVPVIQDESQVTLASKIHKSEALINWNLKAEQIDCKIRAFNAGPGTHTFWNEKKLKIQRAHPASPETMGLTSSNIVLPGTVVKITAEGLVVNTGEGFLVITELQPESRNVMNVSQFLQGHSELKPGTVFK